MNDQTGPWLLIGLLLGVTLLLLLERRSQPAGAPVAQQGWMMQMDAAGNVRAVPVPMNGVV